MAMRSLPTPLTPQIRKRERTKRQLMDAAVATFARKGIAPTTVFDIAQAAGLANATFYYHFKDKAALVEAVSRTLLVKVVDDLAGPANRFEDAAERVAYCTLRFMEQAKVDPDWGNLLIRAQQDIDGFRDALSRGIAKTLARGVAQGRFAIELSDQVLLFVLSVTAAGIQMNMSRRGRREVSPLTAEYCLRLLGLSPREAAEVTARVLNAFRGEAANPAQSSALS